MSTDLIRAISNLPLPDQLAFARRQLAAWKGHIKKVRQLILDGDEACKVGLDWEIVITEEPWHSVRLEEAKRLLSPELFDKVIKASTSQYVWTVRRGKPETTTPPETTEGAAEGGEDGC
jgi:hypothetical protein